MGSGIFERADGTRHTLAGYNYQEADENTKRYVKVSSNNELPRKVDLRKLMTPVENQGQTHSCVAHAVAGAYEYLAKKHLEEDYDVSRMFIYYNARYLDDQSTINDGGSYIRKAIEGLQEYGACSEEMYPFDLESINDEPYQEAYDEGAEFLIEETQLVETNLSTWKHCLAEGHPIIFAINLYKSFDKQPKKGVIPQPSQRESSRGAHGAHAMLAVGYSDIDEVFIIRNSWGDHWGDQGYCYIPYDYLMNKEQNHGDSWIIKQLANVELDTNEYWSDDDESIMGDYDTELSNMSQEEYDNMIEAMGDYLLEYRIALLFLYASNGDDDLSDEEYDTIGEYMDEILGKLDSNLQSSKVLKYAVKDANNKELIIETIELFATYFSHEFLVNLLADIENAIAVDELSDEESNIVEKLMEYWQISEDDYEYEDEEVTDEEIQEDESFLGDYNTEISNMSQEEYDNMMEAMGDYLLEYRIALLFVYIANIDDNLSDEEYEAIGEYMDVILGKLNSDFKSSKVLKRAINDINNEALIEETIELFLIHFSHEFLVNLLANIENSIMVDEVSDEESNIIENLKEYWGISEDDYS